MKLASIGMSALALVLTAGVANAGGYDRGPISKSKTWYYAKSSNDVSASLNYKFKSAGCGCKGEVDAFSWKEHNDYAKKTRYGYEAGGAGAAGNTITWKGAKVYGSGSTFVSGTSSVGFGGSTSKMYGGKRGH